MVSTQDISLQESCPAFITLVLFTCFEQHHTDWRRSHALPPNEAIAFTGLATITSSTFVSLLSNKHPHSHIPLAQPPPFVTVVTTETDRHTSALANMASPPGTPPVKSEPRDSPLPTPHSTEPVQPHDDLRRDSFDENASPTRRAIDLGKSMLTGPHDRPDAGKRLMIDMSQDEGENGKNGPYDPFADRPAYEKGPKLKFHQLDEYQKRAIHAATIRRENICCVGGAGTGKSGTCEVILDELKDGKRRVAIVAPSGTAAVNVRAQTLHSFFGLGASTNIGIEDLVRKMKPTVRERIQNTEVLIIDEISMVSYETFDRMDRLARDAHEEPDIPFGGMQILVFGDFCQLPPVKPHQHCFTCGRERTRVTLAKRKRGKPSQEVWRCPDHGDIHDGDKMWAFKSAQWDDVGFTYIPLNRVHRQQDPVFLGILANVRFGKPFTANEFELLTNHDCDVANAVELTAKRDEVERINDDCLDELRGPEHRYECQDDFVWQERLHPELEHVHKNKSFALKERSYEETVCLKQGQPVILLRNINVGKGLVNGSQGVIEHFVDYDQARQRREHSLDEENVSRVRSNNTRNFMRHQRRARLSTQAPVVKFNNYPDPVTIFPDCNVQELGFKEPHSLLSRTQIPLLAGWALTIHKAQGMTLEKATVDLGDIFSCGMAYVALSRVKTLTGLKVKGLRPTTMVHAVDEEVKDFLELHFEADFD